MNFIQSLYGGHVLYRLFFIFILKTCLGLCDWFTDILYNLTNQTNNKL